MLYMLGHGTLALLKALVLHFPSQEYLILIITLWALCMLVYAWVIIFRQNLESHVFSVSFGRDGFLNEAEFNELLRYLFRDRNGFHPISDKQKADMMKLLDEKQVTSIRLIDSLTDFDPYIKESHPTAFLTLCFISAGWQDRFWRIPDLLASLVQAGERERSPRLPFLQP